MHLHNQNFRPEYRESNGKVLRCINQNLAGDVSVETPARRSGGHRVKMRINEIKYNYQPIDNF
jgi:hypothetical protein